MALHLELVLEILGFFCLVDLLLPGLIFLCVCAQPWDGFLVPYILVESVQFAIRVGRSTHMETRTAAGLSCVGLRGLCCLCWLLLWACFDRPAFSGFSDKLSFATLHRKLC